jgi:hypothetical protein
LLRLGQQAGGYAQEKEWAHESLRSATVCGNLSHRRDKATSQSGGSRLLAVGSALERYLE